MTSEHVKRAREGFQIPFPECNALASYGVHGSIHPAPERYVEANEESPRTDSLRHTEPTRSPALKRARGEAVPPCRDGAVDIPMYERTLPTRGALIEIIRGDSGRRFLFTFMTDVRCRWHVRNTIYYAAAFPSVPGGVSRNSSGCDLEEVVCAYTWLPYHGAPRCAPSTINEELIDGAARETPLTYYYTKTGTSRVPLPLEPPPRDHVGPRTAPLLVDCLLECAAEEASITEPSNWAWLFCGKSLRSEQGRALLEAQLLAACLQGSRANSVEPPPPATVAPRLQICVFRKC